MTTALHTRILLERQREWFCVRTNTIFQVLSFCKQCIPRKGCLVSWGKPHDVFVSVNEQETKFPQTAFMQSYDCNFSVI